MRVGRTAYVIPALFLLLSPVALGQMPAVPENPHELVTQNATMVSKAKERSAALGLLDRARAQLNLHAAGGDAFTMKVSFTSSGATPTEGTMEETWLDSAWRWTAEMGGASYTRVGAGNQVYGTSADEPIPMRLQMVRSAIFASIPPRLGAAAIRAASTNFRDREITCFLASGMTGINPAPRFWVETEYCIDASTALLQMWSEAPGIYVTYDYDGALEFHGHTLAREITVTEGSETVLQIHIESLEDAQGADAKALAPTEEMIPSSPLSGPYRFPMRVDPEGQASSGVIRPVIVHATLGGQDGNVLDAEVVEASDPNLGQEALDLVWNSSYPPTGMQREVFINVQFHMPLESGASASLRPVIWVPIGVARVSRRPRRASIHSKAPLTAAPVAN
jgi:hypothetical protein